MKWYQVTDALKANKFLRFVFRKKGIYLKDKIQREGITIGEYTYGLPTIHKWTNKYQLKIGKFGSIAENVRIIVDGNHRPEWVSTYSFGELIPGVPKNPGHPEGRGNMEIGHDVWIGMSALILPGVSIGDGAIVGAGSIVTKNVGDYEIVAGNPAKHLKFRFTPEQITALKKIAWWNWDIEKIKKEIPLLQLGDVDGFIRKHL